MANKKPRTPMPPRTVQAPKRRDTKRSTPGLSDVPRWVWLVAVAIVAAVIAGVVVLAGGGSSKAADLKTTMTAAGCTYRDVKPIPPRKDPTNYHADVPTLTTPTKGLWSTDPPSAGAHYGLWAVWGFYKTPVNPRQVVHNEEHGAVVMWWGDKVPQSTVAQLQAFYNKESDGMFGTPYPSLGDKIALTAWTGDPNHYYVNHDYGVGHIAICSGFNQKAFTAFRDAYRGKGPEGIPLSQDKQGMGPQ